MTDWNIRDVFFLFTGRCGHKWVAAYVVDECPVCRDVAEDGRHVVTGEPIPVSLAYVWPKLSRRRTRAIRAHRQRPRKTAAVVSLTAHGLEA